MNLSWHARSVCGMLCMRFQGHLLYGIKSVSVYADGLTAIVADCSKAAKSADARDKYFLVSVGESDPFPAQALRSELPALEAAQASLASTTSDLADVLPRISLCHAGVMSAVKDAESPEGRNVLGAVGHADAGPSFIASTSGGGSRVAQSAFDQGAVDLLLQEARASIVGVREVLA